MDGCYKRDFSGMTAGEVRGLMVAAQDHHEEEKSKIEHDYGKIFCDAVGTDRILDLPKMSAEELHLVDIGKYPTEIVTPSMLKGHSAVRGMSDDRPFVAVKIKIHDSNHEEIGEVVEVIMKRYTLTGDGKPGGCYEHNYITSLSNKTEDGKTFSSKLYSTGGMVPKQLHALKSLLKGKEVVSPISDSYFIKKA